MLEAIVLKKFKIQSIPFLLILYILINARDVKIYMQYNKVIEIFN